MDSRERLTRCYKNMETDRPAVSNLTYLPDDPSYDALRKYLDEYSDLRKYWLNMGFFYSYPSLEEEFGSCLDFHCSKKPYSKDHERVELLLETPAGNLESSFFHGLNGNPGYTETYFIKDRIDAEKYLSLPMPEIGADLSLFFELDKAIGRRGIANIWLGHNPAGFAAELLGSENFALMSITDRDILHLLCERQMNILMRSVKYLIDNNAGPFFSMDGEEYITPPLHGAKDFYDFNVKYDKPIVDLIHESGGMLQIHCHGRMKDVIHGFIDIGTDVLHPVESPPTGNITVKEAKVILRNKVCIEGNIQISRFYEASAGDLAEETELLIKEAFDDSKGLIVCPSASPYIVGKGDECFETFKAMIDTVVNWKA